MTPDQLAALATTARQALPDGVSIQVRIDLETGKPNFSVSLHGKPEQETINPFLAQQFETAAHMATRDLDFRQPRDRDEASDALLLNLPKVKEVMWVDFNKKVVL